MKRIVVFTFIFNNIILLLLAINFCPVQAVREVQAKSGTTVSPDEGSDDLALSAVSADNVYLINHIGGKASVVEVAGNLAYLGIGPRLVILDVSNPANPVFLSQSAPFPGNIRDLAVAGEYAYVVALGLRVVDVSNPAHPFEVSVYDPWWSGLMIQITLADHYGYLISFSDGVGSLYVIDLSDPLNIFEAGKFTRPQMISDIAVSGKYVFIVDGLSADLWIVDMSDPTYPVLVSYRGFGRYIYARVEGYVTVVGDYVYVDFGFGTHILDISTISDPVDLGDQAFSIRNAVLSGSHVYVADGSVFHVIDVSSPPNPVAVGSYDLPASASDLAMSGNHAFIADGNLQVLSVSDPTKPLAAGHYDSTGDGFAVTVADGYAYVGFDSGLSIMDVSRPSNPVLLGKTEPFAGNISDIALSGTRAFVTVWEVGLRVIDISDQTNPTMIGSYDTPGRALGIAVSGDFAFVADGAQLQVFDVSDPTNPIGVASYDSPAKDVFVSGNYAYIVAKYPGLPGLSVVDVSDPANPTEAGFLDIFKSPSSLDVAGNYAYVADRLDGLYVVDISDPARPAEVSFFAIYGAEKVATSPGFAYVTTGYCECDLQVVNLTDPEYPVAAGSYYQVPAGSWPAASTPSLAVFDGYVYLASSGLYILKYMTVSPRAYLSAILYP